MFRTLTKMGALACALLITVAAAGPTGCGTVEKVTSNDKGLMHGQKIDEQSIGVVHGLGAAANILIEGLAKSGELDQAQLDKLKKARADLKRVVAAAETAKAMGDAPTFKARLAELRTLYGQVVALAAER